MFGIKLTNYMSCLLILIDVTVASNMGGFCNFEETYLEPVTFIQTYKSRITYTVVCGFWKSKRCHDFRDTINTRVVVQQLMKSKIKYQCCHGYISKGFDCAPVCSIPCLNGQCTQPEVCTCSNGYHKNDIGICIENECDPTSLENGICRNGTCMPNGICSCNKGFVKNNSSNECLPVCIGCNNGNCVAPGKCLCNAGFEWTDSRLTCVPKCSQGCLNGNCIAPNNCVCNEGYESISSSNNICNPVCLSGCLNRSCIKPNVCSCDLGYELDESLMLCVPTCDEECVNSNCTAPNVCTCELGFSRINSTVCEIPCVNCTNGYCEIANKCQCDSGYHMSNDNSTCIPNECSSNILEDSCVNGYCSDDGFCVCNSGYTRNISMICSPDCSLKCINGYCSEPEVCQCYDGYVLGNGTDYLSNCTNCSTILSNWNVCDPICDNCFDGKCSQPDLCTQEANSRNQSSTQGYFWIIAVIGLGVILFVSIVFVYRRFVRPKSYICNEDVVHYKTQYDKEL